MRTILMMAALAGCGGGGTDPDVDAPLGTGHEGACTGINPPNAIGPACLGLYGDKRARCDKTFMHEGANGCCDVFVQQGAFFECVRPLVGCDVDAFIRDNHGHNWYAPFGDLELAETKTYPFTGTATHTHEITVTGGDWGALSRVGGNTGVQSTTVNGHSHVVLMDCR